MNKRPGWTEIFRPREIKFATIFIALKSLHDHKLDLQATVTDKYHMCIGIFVGLDSIFGIKLHYFMVYAHIFSITLGLGFFEF